MADMRSILDRIVQGKESTKAPPADDHLFVRISDEVLSHGFDIINQLLEGVGLGSRALAMPSVVE